MNGANDDQHEKIQMSRSKHTQESFLREMAYEMAPSSKKSFVARKLEEMNKETWQSCACKIIPALSWMSSYKRNDFLSDVVSGCTVAVLQIPQGMGSTLLANLPPVVGIYMAFYPILVYALLGTSRHNSMGMWRICVMEPTEYSAENFLASMAYTRTFAVISIMVGKVVASYSGDYSPIEVATLLCFLVGVIQLIMYVLRLGVLSFLLSECLVSGFTTGCAIHVVTSQVKDLLGIALPRMHGNFEVIKTYIEVFYRLGEVNVAAVILSAVTIVLLLINNEILKPCVASVSRIPVPAELIVIVANTVLSGHFEINKRFNIALLGDIPLGLPDATLPRFDLWRELLLDSAAIAFVSYSITVSMALIFGKRLKYDIDFNQELLAMGSSNIFSSFFACFPTCAALSRSLVQQSSGGRSQLASLVSCGLILCALMWIGPFFEVLPRCILASIFVVAMKGMLVQVADFSRFRKKSKMDGFVWIATCLTVTFVSIDLGLLVGVCLSVACILFNGLKCYVSVLGNVPGTELFLDVENFQKALEIPNVKILQLSGTINFATKTLFKNQICEKLGINLIEELKRRRETDKSQKSRESSINFEHLILDFAPLINIDASSIAMLTDLIKDFNELNLKVSITSCSTRVYKIFVKNELAFMDILYPSIQDAEIILLGDSQTEL